MFRFLGLESDQPLWGPQCASFSPPKWDGSFFFIISSISCVAGLNEVVVPITLSGKSAVESGCLSRFIEAESEEPGRH